MVVEYSFSDFKMVYLYSLMGQVIFIIALIQMSYQKRSPKSMIAWLLAFFLMPYITVPFYLLVGLRKQRYYKEKLSLSVHKSVGHSYEKLPVQSGNHFELFTTGEEQYASLMQMIEQSQQSIYITVYKLEIDKSTTLILDALQKKAQSGVSVKILLDALGSINLYILQYKLSSYRKNGIEIAFFMPILKMPFRNYINLRNHRKAFVFDQVTVLSGGINLADTYLGPTVNKKRWADIMFLIKGKAARSYLEIFCADWDYATKVKLKTSDHDIADCGDVNIQVIPSGPDVKDDHLYEELLKLLYNARKRIWMVTPYFIPNEGILDALIIAKHNGVDVRLITPRNSDHLVADLGRSSFMRELEEHDIYIGLFEDTMLHAKAMIIDDIGLLGSANISYRSMFLNYETVSLFDSKEVVTKMEVWMNDLLSHSTQEIRHHGKLRRLGENLMKVFTPMM